MVVDLRRTLGAVGITAEGLRERLDVSAKLAATEPRGHAILVISYHRADIYPTDATNAEPRRIVPEDPRGRLRKMHHKAGNPAGWYGRIEKSWYAELAKALRPAPQILRIGNGKGHSNSMLQVMQPGTTRPRPDETDRRLDRDRRRGLDRGGDTGVLQELLRRPAAARSRRRPLGRELGPGPKRADSVGAHQGLASEPGRPSQAFLPPRAHRSPSNYV
jgi:hypothetical protein